MSNVAKKCNTRAQSKRDRLEYRALVTASYLPCLAFTAYSRATGATSEQSGQSVFAEALSSARAAVGYAYLA